jgi:hypothetical protein
MFKHRAQPEVSPNHLHSHDFRHVVIFTAETVDNKYEYLAQRISHRMTMTPTFKNKKGYCTLQLSVFFNVAKLWQNVTAAPRAASI